MLLAADLKAFGLALGVFVLNSRLVRGLLSQWILKPWQRQVHGAFVRIRRTEFCVDSSCQAGTAMFDSLHRSSKVDNKGKLSEKCDSFDQTDRVQKFSLILKLLHI